MRVLISGASGLMGQQLTRLLSGAGHEVTRLVRRSPISSNEIQWDVTEPPTAAVSRADAVINLNGASVAGRWSNSYRQKILQSRVGPTRSLAQAISDSGNLPVFISMSAVGVYGNRPGQSLTESAQPADTFLSHVVLEWEAAATVAREAGARVVHPRLAMVLDRKSGALAKLLPLYRLGMGGPIGNGKQDWPWISARDAARGIEHMIASNLDGPVNLVAPQVITNAEFNKALGRALRRPAFIPVPPFALRLAIGEFANELLASQAVVPEKLQKSGFKWLDGDIDTALTNVLATS